MTNNLNDVLPDNPFWDFSIQFYRQKEAEAALLQLQREYGFNVNVILYFLWYASIGQGGLSQKKVRELLTEIAPWHNKVVLPLRRLRVKLTNQHELYREILGEELNAEQVEQTLMYERIWFVEAKSRSSAQKVSGICRSVASYCYLMRVKADAQLTGIINALCDILLPDLELDDIEKISAERLHDHPKMTKVVGTQLWIDL